MSAQSLESFFLEYTEIRDDGFCWNKNTDRIVRACVPMHVFGHPVQIEAINSICEKYNVAVVEDAAESLGSYYKSRHTGTTSLLSAISFNGNKIITTGGGGMILTNDEALAKKAKHITTTAKIPHSWEFEHDQIGFNYRMPNINAALGFAQFESLEKFLQLKRDVAGRYISWGKKQGVKIVCEPENAESNYWLNAMILDDRDERDRMLKYTNEHNVMTRPVWRPMHKLKMFQNELTVNLDNTNWLEDRLINIPSSVL